MYLTPEKKQELFGQYGKSTTDTGSPESQIALFTYRINHLTEHMKSNRHDYGTQRSLLRLVGKRRKLLMYLKEVDIERYRAILKTLNLRSSTDVQQMKAMLRQCLHLHRKFSMLRHILTTIF